MYDYQWQKCKVHTPDLEVKVVRERSACAHTAFLLSDRLCETSTHFSHRCKLSQRNLRIISTSRVTLQNFMNVMDHSKVNKELPFIWTKSPLKESLARMWYYRIFYSALFQKDGTSELLLHFCKGPDVRSPIKVSSECLNPNWISCAARGLTKTRHGSILYHKPLFMWRCI